MRAPHLMFALTVMVLMVAIVIPIDVYSASNQCTVGDGGDYPDVYTALSNGCFNLRFVSDVEETNQIVISSTGPVNILGDGYTWNLSIGANPMISISNVDSFIMNNLDMVVDINPQNHQNIFLTRESNVIIENVSVYQEEEGNFITFYSDNKTLYVYNVFGISSDNLNKFAFINIAYDGPGTEYANVVVNNLTLINFAYKGIHSYGWGVTGSILNLNITNSTFIDLYGEAILIRMYKELNTYIDGVHVENSYGNSIFFFTILEGNIVVRNGYFVGQYGDGITAITYGHQNVLIEDVYVNESIWGWDGIFLYSYQGGTANISISDVEVENVNVGINIYTEGSLNVDIVDYGSSRTDYASIYIRYGDTSEIYISDVEMENTNVYGIYIESMNGADATIYLEDIEVEGSVNHILITGETGSNIDVYISRLYSLGVPSDSSLKFYTEGRGSLYIEHSYMEDFILDGDIDAVFNETVYNEFTSDILNGASAYMYWTLYVYVESYITKYPIRYVTVNLYNGSTLLQSKPSRSDGVVSFKLEYWFDPDNPFLDDLNIEVVVEKYNYYLDYEKAEKILLESLEHTPQETLPYWLGILGLKVKMISLDAIGISHKMGFISISFYGDFGVITSYYSNNPFIPNIGDVGFHKKYIFYITSSKDYGSWILVDTRVLLDGTWYIETFIINLKEGFIYSNGPLDVRGYIIGYR